MSASRSDGQDNFAKKNERMVEIAGTKIDVVKEAQKRLLDTRYKLTSEDKKKFAELKFEEMAVIVKETNGETILKARTIQINHTDNNHSASKKAIVYITGNRHDSEYVLPAIKPLMERVALMAVCEANPLNISVFCQDFRGSGINAIEDVRFNEYNVERHVDDQAALVMHLVDQGFLPENITIIGHSLGSNVAFWLLQKLREKDPIYLRVNLISDRGNSADLSKEPSIANAIITSFIVKKHLPEIHEKLTQHAWLSPVSPSDMALRHKHRCLVMHVVDDDFVSYQASLAEAVKREDFPGRVWVLNAISKLDAHEQMLDQLVLPSIKELTAAHLLTAILCELPIKIKHHAGVSPLTVKDKVIQGYALRKEAVRGDEDYIELPSVLQVVSDKNQAALSQGLTICPAIVPDLINDLHEYCVKQADRSVYYGKGGDYYYSSHDKENGLSFRRKIQTAVKLMTALCGDDGVDAKAIFAMKDEPGAHLDKSGSLKEVFMRMTVFAQEYTALQQFNDWIKSLQQYRHELEKSKSRRLIEGHFLFSSSAKPAGDGDVCDEKKSLGLK